ncbi:hypothetical protein D3C72_1519760 [compost metagenome]
MAFARGHCRAPIQRGTQLQLYIREAGAHALEEAKIHRLGFGQHHTVAYVQPGLLQLIQTTTGDLRIRILHRRNHTGNAGGDQCIGTRRRAAMVATRLQRDVSRGTTGFFARHAQRMHFRMGFTGAQMVAFADDFAIAHNHAADVRVRCRSKTPQPRQFEGARHIQFVVMHQSSLSPADGRSLRRIRGYLQSCDKPRQSEYRPLYPAFSAHPSPGCPPV